MKKNIIILCAIFLHVLPSNAIVTFRFVQGNFSVSKKGTCIDPFYKIKAISRHTSSLSAGCGQLSRTINKLYATSVIDYKRNFGNYRQLMVIRAFELCHYQESHPFFKFFAEWILPGDLVKRCPLTGEDFRIYNLTYNPVPVSIWPDGYYRSFLSLSDELDDGIMNCTSIVKVTNSNNIEEFK